MTENEAIKILKNPTKYTRVRDDDVILSSDFAKAYELAIQALTDIQAYRAIGTVEECRTAVERMKPRKVVNKKGFIIAKDKGGNEFYEANPYCPSCNTPIDNGGTAKGVYCKWCGQRFDWSE